MNASAKGLLIATVVALAGCAQAPLREPHHYSRDAHGDRIACYETDVAREYECVPLHRPAPLSPYPYDPFWPAMSLGYYYGVPHWHAGMVWYPYPAEHYHPRYRHPPRRRR